MAAGGDVILVTDGTNSFYNSHKVFQKLHDTSVFDSIIAFSSSAADAKKMLFTRDARYSGLAGKLRMAEGVAAELALGIATTLRQGIAKCP